MGKQTPAFQPSFSNAQKEGLTFPCEFMIKVFGKASAEFAPSILTLLRKHQPHLPEDALQNRPSKDGKYLALSITVHVNSREQLDAIYRELTANPSVLMAL